MILGQRSADANVAPRAADASRTHELGRLALYAFVAHLVVFAGYAGLAAFYGGFDQAVCRWDCNWYGSIVERGYSRQADAQGYANWAFFPLFPLLGGTVARVLHLSFVPAYEIVNFVAFYALIVVSALYARRRFDMTDGYFVALLLLSFPFSLYDRVPYSEAVYGLLIILTLWAYVSGRTWVAGACAAVLCTSRPTGILLVAAIGLCYLGTAAREARQSPGRAFGTVLRGCLFVALGCCGLAAYMIFLQLHVGDALAFSHVEHAWHREFANPVRRLFDGLASPDLIFNNFTAHDSNSARYLSAAGLAGLILVGVAFARRKVAEGLCLLFTLGAAISTSLEALPRIALCNPISILLIGSLLRDVAPAWRWSILSVFMSAQTVLVFAWYKDWAFLT